MHQVTIPKGRQKLAAVIRSAGDVIKTDDVAAMLAIQRPAASRLLSNWARQGWLRRVSRGAYIPVTLDSLDSEHVLSDPWVLVPALFTPAYIGGRTAAEHWGLTEQVFRDIVVMTAQPVRRSSVEKHGACFRLHHKKEADIFGTCTIWRENSQVTVSDIHRTIVDMVDKPALGGGIQQVADCMKQYIAHADRDEARLINYAERDGKGSLFKRLGFLAEMLPASPSLIEACRERLTQGNAKLDTTLDCDRLITRWRLWVPESWTGRSLHDW